MQIVSEIEYTRGQQIGGELGKNSEVFMIDERQLGGVMVAKEIDIAELDVDTYFREAQILYEVEHEHIAPIRYACKRPDRVAIIMPYYQRGCLSTRIAKGPLPQSDAIAVTNGVLRALGHVHEKGIIHFDVKPANVLFSDADRPLLADFGQARRPGALGTMTIPGMYPTVYAPEGLRHGTGSIHTDIYQTGLLLYRAVNGEPFWSRQVPNQPEAAGWDETRNLILKGKLPRRDAFMPHVHKHLRTVIRKALMVDPAQRYQTAREFRRVLSRVVLPVDWRVTEADGRTEWRISRQGQPDLVVEKAQGADGRWGVDVVTVNADGQRRARNPEQFRRPKLANERVADKHLTAVFRALGSPGTRSAVSSEPDDQETQREAAG